MEGVLCLKRESLMENGGPGPYDIDLVLEMICLNGFGSLRAASLHGRALRVTVGPVPNRSVSRMGGE